METKTDNRGRASWLTWFGLLCVLTLISIATLLATGRHQEPLPVYGTVADFSLTNQDGQAVSLATLRGHPWVGDIIFTRCAGPCLRMSRQMKELQAALPANSQVRLVSLTTDPTFDTPAVLKRYAARFNADPQRWMFLTGSKEQISQLACNSLKLTAIEKTPEERTSPEDLFIHSTILVLVDKQGQLRGIFQTGGEGADPAQVRPQVLAALKQLERQS